jgi:hypothetical protein
MASSSRRFLVMFVGACTDQAFLRGAIVSQRSIAYSSSANRLSSTKKTTSCRIPASSS